MSEALDAMSTWAEANQAALTQELDRIAARLEAVSEDRPPADVAGLWLTDPLEPVEGISGVMFSGGVAEYVYAREERDFGDLVGTPPLIAHRTFMWPESAYSEVTFDACVEQGYDATVYRVLVAHPDEIIPVATNPLVNVRPFTMQHDWDDWS